jgi:heme/copper-type cytochrome/quinol oxidase subunit 1
VRKLSGPQRTVIIVGLAVGLWFVGRYIVAGGNGSFGWVAYAPLSNTTDGPNLGGLALWAQLLVWLGLTAAWVLASVFILRSPAERTDD